MKNNHEIILKQYAAYCKEQPLYLGTAGSYGMEMLTIIREGVWAEYDILAAFHPPVGAAVQVRVGANNQIGVPIEATAEKGMGEIVFAGYKEGVRQIAVDVLYKVAPSSGASGTEPAEPTPDVVQQIMLAANAAEKLAQSVRDDADAGEFNGVQGDPGKDAVIDTTLSHAGEAADAAEVGKLKGDIDNILSPNLFNPAVAKENVAISSGDGSEMNGFSGWETTDYIPVSPNDVLYFSANNEPTPYSTGAFYDAQKKFISGFGNPNNNINITVTSDGYARFSFGTSPEKLQIEKGSRTTYVPYGELKIKADVDNVKEDTDNIKAEVSEVKAEVVKIQEDHSNLFNKDTVVKGAVLPDSGYFDTSFSSWETSDYIPVKPEMVLYFSSNGLPIGVASTGAYFDADKKYLSGINNEPTVLTVPDGAYYLRFSKNGGLGNTLNTLKIEQYGITKYTPYGELYVTVNESALPSSILPKWKD